MIDYGVQLRSSIEKREQDRKVTVSFRTEYTQDISNFWSLSTTVFIIVLVLAFLITMTNIYIKGNT